MTPQEYIELAKNTEAPANEVLERVRKLTDGEIKLLKGKLREVINILNDLDKWKKFLFYGKALPDSLSAKGRVFAANCEPPLEFDEPLIRLFHSSIGIATEAGEMLEAIQKVLNGKPLDVINMQEELGDSEWYQAIAYNALNADPSNVMNTNIEKLRIRYPDKFSKENAINRDLETERKILEL